jgi:hypothetical protein
MENRFTAEEAKLILQGTEYEWAAYVLRILLRVPHLEPYIAKLPRVAYVYAKYAIKGRWPEAEPIIAQDPWAALYYATGIIKGRWPEAEPAIARDPLTAQYYPYWPQGSWWSYAYRG